jgi:hypothetical protein
MVKKLATKKPRSRPSRLPRSLPNPDLIEARRTARQAREMVKLTRRLRRDLATHRRELRMLFLDLIRYLNDPQTDGSPSISHEDAREPATV